MSQHKSSAIIKYDVQCHCWWDPFKGCFESLIYYRGDKIMEQ